MAMQGRSWQDVITRYSDLITSDEATRSGFMEQAREKTLRAAQFIQRARALEAAISNITSTDQVLHLTDVRDEIIAAAGFSDKAKGKFSSSALDGAIKSILDSIYEKCVELYSSQDSETVAAAFRSEIIQRFLLTRGDTLGGQIRNWTGARAGQRFNQALLDALQRRMLKVKYESADEEKLLTEGLAFASKVDEEETVAENDDAGNETDKANLRNVPIRWDGRLLLLNAKPTLHCNGTGVVLNNIDMILLDTTGLSDEGAPKSGTKAYKEWDRKRITQNPFRYLACGELKGGIDPAGADEHWKTALSGIARIPENFVSCGKCGVSVESPHLFFVGAAIGTKMAQEIYNRLASRWLTHAANLTIPAQVEVLADWLVSL